MSNSSFAENYLQHRNANGFVGGAETSTVGLFIGGGKTTELTKQQLSSIVDTLQQATFDIAQGTNKVAAQAIIDAKERVQKAIEILGGLNTNKLVSNENLANLYSNTLIGGVQSQDVFDSNYFTGNNISDTVNYLVDSAMFVGGASIELTNDLKNTMSMLEIYLTLLNEITNNLNSKAKKQNVETMDLLQRQKQAVSKLLDLYKNLKKDMHTDSDEYSVVMKKLYKDGNVDKLKNMIQNSANKKELLEALKLAAKLERPTLYYSDKLKKAIDDIGGSMSEFEKIKTTSQLDNLITKYLLEVKKSGNAKRLKKFRKAVETVRSLMEAKIYGSNEPVDVEGAGEEVEMEGSSEPLYTPITSLVGAGEVESLFEGGEFEELNKEVKLQLGISDKVTGLNPEKKLFVEENNKLISEMLISAKEAAYEFHKLQQYDDVEILGFLRRLYVLNNIDTDRMDVFFSRGRDYTKNYVRDEFIYGLKDLVLAAKKIENKVPKIKSFYHNVEQYISFLERWSKLSDSMKFQGGDGCSGVSSSDIYDRFESDADLFYGGIVGMQFSDIIDVFSKSIMVGRMQNGLNLTIDEVKKFSDEQEKVNEKIISKQINEYLLMMQKYYDNYKEEDTFPISKGLFGSVLRDNLNGVKQLLHAAQALDKKIRTYHLKVIENPQAAKDLVQMLSKVVIDLNWITDPEFTELKEFNKYFHIESVAKNHNKYGKKTLTKVQTNDDNANSEMREDVLTGNVTNYNNYKNDYIKEGKDSPFPPYFKDCLMTHVSTLITAMKEPKNDIEEIIKLKQGDFKANSNVNYYFGKNIFPAKFMNSNDVLRSNYGLPLNNTTENTYDNTKITEGSVDTRSLRAGVPNHNNNIVPIASAFAIPQTIKFLDKNVVGSFYREAQNNLRKAVDSILASRNLFSVFDQIDKAYAKDSGSAKTGEKVGKIYASVKEYLILSAMYPTIYSDGDKYMAGHIAMRKFGHEIVCPINESEVKFRSTELLGDLQINSLREYSKGYVNDKTWNVGNNKPFPGFNENNENVDGPAGASPQEKTNYEIRSKCEFVNMFTKCDQLLVMMMKSMFVKIMSIMSMYNVVNFQTDDTGALTNTLPYHQLRTIYGGIDNFFNTTPDVIPENSELYIRVFYYLMFYKELFFEENANSNLIHIVAGARRFALLPINEGKFTGLMKLFFLKWFNVRFTNDEQVLSDVDISTFVNECNNLAKSVSGTPRSKAEKIVSELVKDINHRYGLVFTDDIRKLMDKDKDYSYPELKRLEGRTRTDANNKFRTNVIRRTSTILDGEDEGLADAASKSKEYGQTILGQATILSANETETYNLNEHLAAVYNFRKKLDLLTADLDSKFQSMMKGANIENNVENSKISGLFRYIMILRYKLETQRNPVDRYRIFKEYLLTRSNSLVYKVSQESLLFKELVITPCNLLFKIYVRLIGSINIYGRDQIFVDPLLRGTFLYYLDSVNTNLVDVGSTGKAPILDFSRLEEMCNQYLEQTRMYFLQLRSGVVVQYANEMEKVIDFLINTHRSLFSESGLITKIEYDAHPIPNPMYVAGGPAPETIEDPGIRLNPLVDYSEYIHAAYTGNAVGSNSFVLDQAIFEYPDLRDGVPMLTDPRSFITKDPNLQAIKDIQFELLSKGFSPKNIYMLFEYLLFVMYKMFFEKYGKIYTPVLEAFVSALEGLNIGEFNILDFSDELGGNRQRFSGDLPFSNKMAAVYKTLYKYTDRKDTLTEPDITKISKEQVETMRRNIPLFMFLFKFIVKQSFIQLNMMTNDNTYNKVVGPITAELPAGVAGDLFNSFGDRKAELAPIIGGEDPEISFANVKAKYNTINEGNTKAYGIIKDLGKKLKDSIKLNPVGRYNYDYIKDAKMVQTIYPIPVGKDLIDESKRNQLVKDTEDYIKLVKKIKDAPNYKTVKNKKYFDDLESTSVKIRNGINLINDFTGTDYDKYKELIKKITEFEGFNRIEGPVNTFINNFSSEFGDLSMLFNNDLSKLEEKRKKRMSIKTGKGKLYVPESYLEILDLPKSLKCETSSNVFDFNGSTLFDLSIRQDDGVAEHLINFANKNNYDKLMHNTVKVYVYNKIKRNNIKDYNTQANNKQNVVNIQNGDAKFNYNYYNNKDYYNQLMMPTANSYSLFAPILEKKYLGMSENIYEQTFTNIIAMLESFPTAYIPFNTEMDKTGMNYEGLFADAIHNYQEYLSKGKNIEFHEFLNNFIDEKVNLFFMEDADKFFAWYFTFIDTRPIALDNSGVLQLSNIKNRYYGVDDQNTVNYSLNQSWVGTPGESINGNYQTMRNIFIQGLIPIDNVDPDLNSYFNFIDLPLPDYRNVVRSFINKNVFDVNRVYDETFYFGKMEFINPLIYFTRLIMGISDSNIRGNNINYGYGTDSFVIPKGYKAKEGYGLISTGMGQGATENPNEYNYATWAIKKYLLNENQKHVAQFDGGLLNKIGNKVFKRYDNYNTVDKLNYHIRDIAMFILNTKANNQIEAYNKVKLEVSNYLKNHYIKKKIYLPILKPYFIPTLIPEGITLPYNKFGNEVKSKKAELLGFSYFTLSNPSKFSNNDTGVNIYKKEELDILIGNYSPKNLGTILDKNFNRSYVSLLENILVGSGRYKEFIYRNMEFMFYLTNYLNDDNIFYGANKKNNRIDTINEILNNMYENVTLYEDKPNNKGNSLINIAGSLNNDNAHLKDNVNNLVPIFSNTDITDSAMYSPDSFSPLLKGVDISKENKAVYDQLISFILDCINKLGTYNNNIKKIIIAASSNIKALKLLSYISCQGHPLNIANIDAPLNINFNNLTNLAPLANITNYFSDFYVELQNFYKLNRSIIDSYVDNNTSNRANLDRECYSFSIMKQLNLQGSIGFDYDRSTPASTALGGKPAGNTYNKLDINTNLNQNDIDIKFNNVKGINRELTNIESFSLNKKLIDTITEAKLFENFSQSLNIISKLYSGKFLTNIYFYKHLKSIPSEIKENIILLNSLNSTIITSNCVGLANAKSLNGQDLDPAANVNYEKLCYFESNKIKEFKEEFSKYLYDIRSSLKKLTFIEKIIGKRIPGLMVGSMPEFKNIPPLNGNIYAGVTLIQDFNINEVNVPNIINPDGNPVPDPTGPNLCENCGSRCEEAKITARAKNAIKFGTLIYRSLSTTFTEIGSIPKYLETNPYLTEMQSLISLEETLKPTSIAIDLIPGIINTKLGGETANIVKDINRLTDRKGLGLHCNNIKELDELLMGSKNNLLAGLMLFLTDDKMHKITLNDFPWLKQLVGSGSSDILSGIDSNKLSTFVQHFGTLSKYLYELEMKHSFANMFPLFNSLDVPKFRIRGALNNDNAFDLGGGNSSVILYGSTLTVQDSTKISLPFVLQYTSLKGANRPAPGAIQAEYETYRDIIRYYCREIGPGPVINIRPLLEDHVIPIDELVPLIEMNTNVSAIEKYLTEDGKLVSFNNTNYTSRREINKSNMIRNILDIGIFPINIHAMMRELPLANTINNNYSFDIIMKWLGAKDRKDLVDNMSANKAKKQYPMSYLLNPMNQQFITLNDNLIFADRDINSGLAPRLNLKTISNSKHIEPLVSIPVVGPNSIMYSDPNDDNYNYSLSYGTCDTVIFNKYNLAPGSRINDDIVIIGQDNSVRNRQIPIQYYPISWNDNLRQNLYNPDLALLQVNDKSKLVSKLINDNDIPGPTFNNNSTSYYGSQTMYDRNTNDVHNGVDKDLANPILATNIYAEVLYNTYRSNVRKFFEAQPNAYNESIIQEGVTTLFMPELIESKTL